MQTSFEKLGGTYRQVGDYLLPDIEVPDSPQIGIWGQRLKAYIETHLFDPGDSDCETVLDQLYQAYAESHESDPPEINTFDFLKCEFPHLIIVMSHNALRIGITTDKIFDLLCQRGGCMNDCYDFLVCVFVNNKLVLHLQNSYCFFICLRKQNTATAVTTTLYRIIGRMCEAAPSKFP